MNGSGSYSRDRAGFLEELLPALAFLRAQIGQLFPSVRWATLVIHSCPHVPFHQTFLVLFGVTSAGVRSPFFSGCHSLAISGYTVPKLYSGVARLRPVRIVPPGPFLRLFTIAFHS